MRNYPTYLGTPIKAFGDGQPALGSRFDGPIAADLADISQPAAAEAEAQAPMEQPLQLAIGETAVNAV